MRFDSELHPVEVATARAARRSAAVALGIALAIAVGPLSAVELRVAIDGVDGELADNVRRSLTIVEAAERERSPSPARLRRLLDDGRREAARALQPFGHYRPEIDTALERRDDGGWTARFEIDAGPPLTVASRDIRVTGDGADDPELSRLAAAFPLAEGDVLDHRAWGAGKAALADAAARRGYFDAEMALAEIRVDLERYVAELELELASGPRYRFGETTFRQDALSTELLSGYVGWREGEPFRLDEILATQSALGGTGYFSSVGVEPRPERGDAAEVPVTVELRFDERQRWEVGAGYGTDTGPRGTLGLDLRRINRAGHRGHAEARVSEIESSLALRYEIPGGRPLTDLWTISAGWGDLHPDVSESETTRVAVRFDRALGSWRRGLGLAFERELFTIGPDRGRSELLAPEVSWIRSRADVNPYPLHGHRIEIHLRGAAEAVLSEASFFQARALGRLVHAFGDGSPRLLLRAELGAIESDDFRALPPSLRFFAGGDRSVRGYGFQELTPRDGEGLPIGGEVLAAGGVEIDGLFFERWGQRFGAAAFWDVGNALPSFSSGELEHGAGVGLRWLSPVGLVRADVAVAVSEPGTPLRFHFGVGPDL